MHPILFSFNGFSLYSYGLAMALGIGAGAVLGAFRAGKYGFTSEQVWDSILPLVAGGLLGAKLLYLATNWREYLANPSAILASLRGGFVYYGSLIGGFLGAVWYIRRHKLNFLAFSDLAAASLALGQAIGRLGCFFNGCCYGAPSSCGVVFPGLDALPRHPTQLYESGGAFVLFLILLRVPVAPAGRGTGVFLAGYGLLRFMVEILRDDPRGPVLPGGLSVSQFLSAVALAAGVYLLLRTRGTPAPRA